MDAHSTPERATTTTEAVALAALVGILVAGVALAARGDGRRIGDAVAARTSRLVAGDAPTGAQVAPGGVRARGLRTSPSSTARSTTIGGGRWRDQRERRWSAGAQPPRVARDDLRLQPLLPDAAWLRGARAWDSAGRRPPGGGVRARASVEACALCVDSGWRSRVRGGPTLTPATKEAPAEVGGDVEAQGSVALAATEVLGAVEQLTGWGGWSLDGRGRATLGAEVDGRLAAKASATRAELEARGGAMAGAVVRGEARAGFELLGIAVTTSGRAEGWAGAGARGRVAAQRDSTGISWTVGGGAALGLGGAAEWSAGVDVSGVPRRRREAAGRTLAATLAHTPGLAPIGIALEARRSRTTTDEGKR